MKKIIVKILYEKGENADGQHFLLFLECFLSYHGQITSFEPHLNYRLQLLLNLGHSKY